MTNYCKAHLYQGIYISQGSHNNTFYANTVKQPPGSGISIYHNYQTRNMVSHNLIYQHYFQQLPVPFCDTNNDQINNNWILSNEYDRWMNSRFGIDFICGTSTNTFGCHTVIKNQISNNYIYANEQIPFANGYSGGTSLNLRMASILTNSNEKYSNKDYYGKAKAPHKTLIG